MRRSVGRPPSRVFMVLLGLSGIGLTLLIVYIGFRAPDAIPGRSYFTVRAQLADADNIAKHSQVRLGGRIVGQVLDPHVERGFAVVKLQMTPSVKPLRSDTRVAIRPRSAVGVRYVEIVPGTRGRVLRDGELIPATQTSATRQLDEALSTFDPATRERTQTFMRELGQGVAGRGADLSDTLESSPRFLADTATVAGAVAQQRPGATANLIRGSEGAAAAADPVSGALASGFAPEARALRPFSDRASSFQKTLEVAPGALGTVRAGLAQTDPLVVELGGLARNVAPVLAYGPLAFGQTNSLFAQATPALRKVAPALRATGRAVRPTVDLLGSVRPVLPDLDGILADATPVVGELGAHSCDVKAFGRNWGSMMTYGNGGGGYLRLNLVGGSQQSPYGFGDAARVDTGNFQNPYPAPCRAGTERP